MGLDKFITATIEDILENPNKFGAPTFEQFQKNPEKWRKNKYQNLESASAGSQDHKDIYRHVYFVDGYKCKNEEEVESVMIREGHSPDDYEMRVHKTKATNGKSEAIVNFNLKKGPNAKT